MRNEIVTLLFGTESKVSRSFVFRLVYFARVVVP